MLPLLIHPQEADHDYKLKFMAEAMTQLFSRATCPPDSPKWRGVGSEYDPDLSGEPRKWGELVAFPGEEKKYGKGKGALVSFDQQKPCYMGPPRSWACVLAASKDFEPLVTKKNSKSEKQSNRLKDTHKTVQDEYCIGSLFAESSDEEDGAEEEEEGAEEDN